MTDPEYHYPNDREHDGPWPEEADDSRRETAKSPDFEELQNNFGRLAEKYGPIDPSLLPDDDPDVTAAYSMFETWTSNENKRINALPDGEITLERARSSFIATKLMAEAGFADPSYIDDVANDWLMQDLSAAQESGQGELALEIRISIFKLNKRLPEDLKSPGNKLGEALEDVLEIASCAELATMHSTEESLGYAFTLLIEAGVEDPEQYLIDKGFLEKEAATELDEKNE